jgi:RNA polymerase sigma-70 factor (ECF subfamily)
MTDLDKHQLRPLLERVSRGDAQALNELFTRLRPYLHALVRRTLGPDWKDASDVVQSSLRRINENLDDILQDEPTVPHLLAWIKKIVRNRAIDEVRKRNAAPPPGQDGPLENLPGPSQEEAGQRDRRALDVMAALAQLPQRQRQVVELHYFDRLRDNEISARLGGSVAAIRVLRCRALKELRRLMEASDHDCE